jgi:pimeloyl-ACP methyl ester carboxylesterase
MFEFQIPFLSPERANVECGYLVVPERHSQPDGPTIRLAVAIFKSHSPFPAPDPLVIAQGGPGGSSIEFADLIAFNSLRDRRDIILFDQRGTLHSEPALLCPEIDAITEETIEQHLSLEQSFKLEEEALLACRSRLAEEGVDLAAFNSLENAADVEALRLALGYEKINLYGVSYGTLLALHVMRDYPAGLRSVILDAVVPAQTNFITEIPRTQDRAFSELFNACAAGPVCQADYPELEQRFFELVAALNKQPATVPLTDPETGQHYQAILDGHTLIELLFQMLYSTDHIPVLPKLIDNARAGDYTILSNTWPTLAFDHTFSLGMYHSVICAEDADFQVEDMRVDGVRSQIATIAGMQSESILNTCVRWNVPPLGPSVDKPIVSDIPTLLLSGQFDPITPPAFAETVAKTLSNSYAYTFPVNGHGAAIPGNDCSDRIVQTFLDNPDVEPDASCLAKQPPIPDFLPVDTLTLGVISSLAELSGSHLIQLGLLVLCALSLLSAWVIWPLEALIRHLRRKTLPLQPRVARLARWLVVLVGLLSAFFVVGLLYTLFCLFRAEDYSVLIVGLPGNVALLFVLPLLLIPLATAMLVATVMAWRNHYWSIWGRLYYTWLTLSVLVYIGVLIHWDMLAVLLS